MMFDVQALLSDKQAITGTGNVLSTNVIDLFNGNTSLPTDPYGGRAVFDPGRGQPVPVLVQVTADIAGATSVQAQVVTADDSAMSTNLTVVQETAAVPLAQLKAGYQFRFSELPHGLAQRYLAIRYVIVGTATGSGAVTAGIVAAKQQNPIV